MDIYSPEKRSEIMSQIKGKNNRLERKIFSYLRRENVYFQRHYKHAPGTPDIAIPRKKMAVFIEGSFWHGWAYSKRGHRLTPFWRKKIEDNIRRDHRNLKKMREEGWLVLRVWDHRFKKRPDFWLQRIKVFLRQDRFQTHSKLRVEANDIS